MIPEKIRKILRKQHYALVGKHSAVQVCRWTKKSLRGEGVCYKEKFYGIKSHLCCQMTPAVMWCPNKCLHCWRAIELTLGDKMKNFDSPTEIINKCIESQRKLLQGFKRGTEKNLSRADMKKWKEAQEPMQFAISLSGEPMLYDKIGELIGELRNRRKTSFLVTNGLYPEKILELKEKNQLPTQLYVSVNTPNKKLYDRFHQSSMKNAWEKLNETLEILPTLNCRTIFRMNLVKDLNMGEDMIEEYAELIKKSRGEAKSTTASSKSRHKPTFVEVKGFMSVGFARQRLGYDKMPTFEEMENFCKKLATATGLKILDSHEYSRAFVLGKNKEELRIKGSEY